MEKIKLSDLARQAEELSETVFESIVESPIFIGSGRSKRFTLIKGVGLSELKLYSTCLLVVFYGYTKLKDKDSKINSFEFARVCEKVVSYFQYSTNGSQEKLELKLKKEIALAKTGVNSHFAIALGGRSGENKIKILGISKNTDGLRIKLLFDNVEVTITEFDTHGSES